MGYSTKLKTSEVSMAERITMAIFTKLLAMRMVASKRSGSLSKSEMTKETFASDWSMRRMSLGSNEKNATSLPEINADSSSKNAMINRNSKDRKPKPTKNERRKAWSSSELGSSKCLGIR